MGNCACSCLSSPSNSSNGEGKTNYTTIDGSEALGVRNDGNDLDNGPTILQHISERDGKLN